MAYTNEMCAHVWAQQTRDSGQSSNGNLNFSGRTIRSYSTPIAYYGERAILVTTRTYSITTSGKHMPAVRRALGYGGTHNSRPIFYVPNLSETPDDITANLAYLVERYTSTTASARRSTLRLEWLFNQMNEAADDIARFALAYGLETPALDVTADIAAVQAHHAAREAKNNTPAATERRKADKARREAKREEAERLARVEPLERLEAWRNGTLARLERWNDLRTGANGSAFLRVRGDKLETSQGATVPLADAIRVYHAVRRARDTSRPATDIVWQRNGERLDVGDFTVDRIFADGSFRAGCHLIQWSEIERAAIAAGVAE